MSFSYLLILAISIAGLASLDRKHSLVFFHDAARAAIVIATGVVFFLCWDVAGIALNVFFKGGSPLLTGVMLANQLPLEEPIFLALLCYSALMFYRAFENRAKK
mgnify:CR=1 FL=1